MRPTVFKRTFHLKDKQRFFKRIFHLKNEETAYYKCDRSQVYELALWLERRKSGNCGRGGQW